MRIEKTVVLILLLGLCSMMAAAYPLRGTVLASGAGPLSGVSVYVAGSTYGVVTNAKGEFVMELGAGSHILVFSYLGYNRLELEVVLPNDKGVRVELEPEIFSLEEVSVSARGKDPAYELMRLASENRNKHLLAYQSFRVNAYLKASLQKQDLKAGPDSLPNDSGQYATKERMNLLEKYSALSWQAPAHRKEVVMAYKDYTDEPEVLDISSTLGSYGFYVESPQNYDPMGVQGENSLLFYLHPLETDINLYKALVTIGQINDMPFISPLHPLAAASYKFGLEESFVLGNLLVHKISVLPRRAGEPLFSGHIFLVDGDWAILTADLALPAQASGVFTHLRFAQNFEKHPSGAWLCSREEFFYEALDEGITYMGNTLVRYMDHEVDPVFSPGFFNGEVYALTPDAGAMANELLERFRPVTLKKEERRFIQTQDSLLVVRAGPGYLVERDSSFNRTSVWDVLLFGIQHQNSFKGTYWYFMPVLLQPRVFQPGGYRHALGLNCSKFFKNTGQKLETYAQLDYGFLNQDLRGHAKAAYTFNSFNFSRASLGFGSQYRLLNENPSVVANLSPGNYNREDHVELGYDREIVNGVYVNTKALFVRHSPVTNLAAPLFMDSLEAWLGSEFTHELSSFFKPVYFEPYTKLMLEWDLAIRFKQKYWTTPVRKMVMGSDWPKLNVFVRLGIPGILGSISSFGFAQLRVNDVVPLGSFGYSQYHVDLGGFFWKKAVQLVDEKFFIGGDYIWFTNPLRAQQLLGHSLRTTHPFVEYHYRHTFDGAIMNKLPVLRRLRLGLVLGTNGLLLTGRSAMVHLETYYGLEKKFRAGLQLFKVGLYRIDGYNSIADFQSDWRLGFTVFNPATKTWL
jgi:hypothetical protein